MNLVQYRAFAAVAPSPLTSRMESDKTEKAFQFPDTNRAVGQFRSLYGVTLAGQNGDRLTKEINP